MNKTNNTATKNSLNTLSAKNNTKTSTNTSTNNSVKTNATQNNNKQLNNKTNTNTSSNSASGSKSSTFGIVILVLVILFLIGGMYWLYKFYTSRTFQSFLSADLMIDITDATNTTTVPANTIPTSSYSNEYAISFWMNIDDYNYNYGTEKTILSRGTIGNPSIVLGDKHNDLIVRVNLQGPVSKTVSGFEDIPIKIPSLNSGSGFIQPETVIPNSDTTSISTTDTDISNIPESFKKIGSNNIDYPTIQYTFDTNDSISNCGYFDLISGNNVNKSNKVMSNGNKLVEGFSASDDAIAAGVKVIVDICNIANTIQSQSVADSSVSNLNTNFKILIDTMESLKTDGKTVDEINATGILGIGSIPLLIENSQLSKFDENALLNKQLATLQSDVQVLSGFANVQVDYTEFSNAINMQMSAIKCPLVMTGTTDIDKAVSFYENIINLIKKTLFIYISNMNSGISKLYPELSDGTQGGSCLSNLYTNNDPSVGMCVVKMIPLQKWVSVIVSVYNQIIDIYIDGQLSSSCVLQGFPNISTDDINITPNGGFSGKISRVTYMNTAVTIKQARDIYYSGPVATTSLFSMIPNWVYWILLLIIIVAIAYSFFM